MSPLQGKLFYLQTLLQHNPSRSFVHAQTIDNITFQSYQLAAIHFGIFADDHESDYALNEAIQTLCTPQQLRLLFVHLLVKDCIPTPLETWNRFHMHFTTDYIENHSNIDLALNFALVIGTATRTNKTVASRYMT